jgi:hypothetical protein
MKTKYPTLAHVAVLFAIVNLLALVPSRSTAQYLFTEIARAGSVGPETQDFAELLADSSGYYFSLNNAGTVAFRAATFANGVNGVYSGAGGVITKIAETGVGSPFASFTFTGLPAINISGEVAFTAYTPALADKVILRGNGGSITQMVSRASEGFSSLGDSPSINSAGAVAFLASAPLGVYLSDGGSVTPLYVVGGPYGFAISDASFKDAGEVVFIGKDSTGTDGMFRGSGGALSTIAVSSASGGPFSGFPGGPGSMNSAGVVAFDAFLASGGEGVFVSTGSGAPVTIADSSGPFDDFKGSPAISLYGIAFTASLDGGGTGIFTGADPVTNKVIQVGDALFGATVTSIQSLGRFAINDSGEIAFVASLSNGDTVLVRATPGTPEPPILRVFATGTNSVVVAWPASSTGFRLQSNTNLTTTNWVNVMSKWTIVGSEKQVTITPLVDAAHFRLVYP